MIRGAQRQPLTPIERECIAGFIDGDGYVYLAPPRPDNDPPIPYVSAGQSCNHGEPPELCFLRDRLGGRIRRVANTRYGMKIAWIWTVRTSAEVEVALECLVEHAIVKQREAQAALHYIRGGRADPLLTHDQLRRFKQDRQDIVVDETRLGPAYLAGLFAAEGSVGLYEYRSSGRFRTSAYLTQKGCLPLLRGIVQTLGYGIIGNGRFKVECAQAIGFLSLVRPHLEWSQKARQVDATLEYVEKRAKRKHFMLTDNEIDEARAVVARVKDMKKDLI